MKFTLNESTRFAQKLSKYILVFNKTKYFEKLPKIIIKRETTIDYI